MKKTILITVLISMAFRIYAENLPSYVPIQGLVGWWNLDGNAEDASGQNNHGKVYRVVPTQNRYGEKGKAMYFNGKNQRIEIPDHPSLRNTELTISLWVQCESSTLSSIIYKANREDASSEVFSINNTPESGLKFKSKCKPALGWNQANFNRNQREIDMKKWTHLAITYDGTSLNQYVNGIHVSKIIYSTPLDNCPGGNIHLGYCWDKFPFSFMGSIDELGIWKRALSKQEIQQVFDSKNPPPTLKIIKQVQLKVHGYSRDTLNILYDSIHETLHFNFNKTPSYKSHYIRICTSRDEPHDYIELNKKEQFLNASLWNIRITNVKVKEPDQLEVDFKERDEDPITPPYYFIKIFEDSGILLEVVKFTIK